MILLMLMMILAFSLKRVQIEAFLDFCPDQCWWLAAQMASHHFTGQLIGQPNSIMIAMIMMTIL